MAKKVWEKRRVLTIDQLKALPSFIKEDEAGFLRFKDQLAFSGSMLETCGKEIEITEQYGYPLSRDFWIYPELSLSLKGDKAKVRDCWDAEWSYGWDVIEGNLCQKGKTIQKFDEVEYYDSKAEGNKTVATE